MADTSSVIEGFVVDPAFTDASKTISGVLTDESVKVAALNSKALSYFNKPAKYPDTRLPETRQVNWTAETLANLVFDEQLFSHFVEVVNDLETPVTNGVFKLIDKIFFRHTVGKTPAELEAELVNDADIANIYVPNSLEMATQVVNDSVYYSSGTAVTVGVPVQAKFSLTLPVGQTEEVFVLRIFAHVPTWLTGYNFSTIAKVIPPLPYAQLYSASLVNSNDSIFNTSKVTATLAFSTQQTLLGTVSVSGITEFNAVLVDLAGNTVSVPFNIIFKGRTPTLPEIRAAIREELLNSGVGTQEGWEQRIPGVFVAGRFYLVPFWDLTFQKPNSVIYPSINSHTVLGQKVNQILESTGFGDVRPVTDIVSVYFDRMTVAAVPDMTGVVDIVQLAEVIPDYQNFTPEEENFAYMGALAKSFSTEINRILAIDARDLDPGVYIPITENLLEFYSFVVDRYELCVITKLCYTTIMESVQ